MHWTIVLLLLFTLSPVVEARLPSSVGSIQASGFTILTFIKFILPPLAKDKWTEYNNELNLILQPIHNALSSDLIDPKTAGDQIAKISQDFLLSKPEFETSPNEQYKSHPSKLVEKAKSVKNSYRKSMRNFEPIINCLKTKEPRIKQKLFHIRRSYLDRTSGIFQRKLPMASMDQSPHSLRSPRKLPVSTLAQSTPPLHQLTRPA